MEKKYDCAKNFRASFKINPRGSHLNYSKDLQAFLYAEDRRIFLFFMQTRRAMGKNRIELMKQINNM